MLLAIRDCTYPVIKHNILLPQTSHEGVLGQVILPRRILFVSSFKLLLDRSDILW